MRISFLETGLSVSPQVLPGELTAIAALGFRAILCNRPDGEGADQPSHQELAQAANLLGLAFAYMPVTSGKITGADVLAFDEALSSLPAPVLAYCRTGTRSATLWGLLRGRTLPVNQILDRAAAAGFDLSALQSRIAGDVPAPAQASSQHDVVIVGGGAAGMAVAASLLKRQSTLDIVVIDPAETHFYQPGWTLVGAGVFQPETTARPMASLVPTGVKWLRGAVVAFEPEHHRVVLEGCRQVQYRELVVCPGLKLDWNGVEGLADTLGQNSVTSNYRYDLAPYTWELVQRWRGGRAVFTQPAMPIKCAGAPQKAMYLCCDHWRRNGMLADTDVAFYNPGAVLFGVADYVPALMEYVRAYGIGLNFGQTLVRVDGPGRKAWFSRSKPEGGTELTEVEFDFLHAVPPQCAPDFIRASPLVDAAGWVEVDPSTLRHKRFANIHALGDVAGTSNAKTAAAARKQAPVVAENVLSCLANRSPVAVYDGYGSCPLTVERGKIVLAEFTYGGKVAPTFPRWLIDGTRPSRLAWLLKERMLPPIYWHGMLKGREWLARPQSVKLTGQ